MTQMETKLVFLGKKYINENLSDEETLEAVKNILQFELYLRELKAKYKECFIDKEVA
jgi:hypothetical protein